MKTPPAKRRPLLVGLIGVGTLVPLLGVGAATASFLPSGIGNDWQQWVLNHYLSPLAQIQEQIATGQSTLDTIMNGSLGTLWGKLRSTMGAQTPNPYEVRTTQAEVKAGVLTTNAIVRQRDTANLYDQELSRAMAANVLGEAGRTWSEQAAQRTSELVANNQQGLETTQKLAQEAQSLGATQDVMKHNAKAMATLAGILTNQSRLTADSQTALLKVQQLQGITAQLAANTSEGIDEANRRERVTRQISLSGVTQTELYLPGLYRTGRTRQPAGQ